MTTINATRSELIPKLLRTLVIALSQLSKNDVELNDLIQNINLTRGSLENLQVEELVQLLDKAAFLAQGYYVDEPKGAAKQVPELVQVLKEELDSLVTQQRLMGRTASELLDFSNYFDKLAGK